MSNPYSRDRLQLWNAVWNTYYEAYYQEMLIDWYIIFYQRSDAWTKALVTLTASGSAISGWAFWTQPYAKPVWLTLAGLAAVLSIVNTVLGIPERLKGYEENKRFFTGLRTDIETLRDRMKIDKNFPVAAFTQEHVDLRKRYSQGMQSVKNDPLEAKRISLAVQNQLDNRLKEQKGSIEEAAP